MNFNVKNLTMVAVLILGGFYTYALSISISNVILLNPDGSQKTIQIPFVNNNGEAKQKYHFRLDVDSIFQQEKIFHIAADDEIISIIVNKTKIPFDDIKKKYGVEKLNDWGRGYAFILPLASGENKLEIITQNYMGGISLNVSSKPSYFDYTIIFLMIVLPIILTSINYFDNKIQIGMDFLRQRKKNLIVGESNYLQYLPIFIILLGVLLRVVYLIIYGHSSYQHDLNHHVTFIKYFSENWSLPLPDKGIEFPQQPLYYFFVGKIYYLLNLVDISPKNILFIITSLSTIMMSAALVVAYKAIKKVTSNSFIINTVLAFLAFTPSFLFLSAQINNDVLNYFLATFSVYFIFTYFNTNRSIDFFLALVFCILVFMTKVSSGLLSLFLFMVLLDKYFNALTSYERKHLVLHLKAFSITMAFFLGLSLLRVYLPISEEFLFVISGKFPGQEIQNLNFSYFFSFNIFELIDAGQSYVFETAFNEIKQSYFTWQYATLFFGEYNYKAVFDSLLLNRAIYFFGLIYLVGLIAYLYFLRRMPTVVKFIFPLLLINQLLIVNFAISYPSVCNTDFRYNSPTFLLWGIAIAYGLHQLYSNFKSLRNPVIALVAVTSVSQILWILMLLFVGKTNTIS